LFCISIPLEQRCSSPLLSIHPSSEPTNPITPSALPFSLSMLQPHHTTRPCLPQPTPWRSPLSSCPRHPNRALMDCNAHDRWLLRVRRPVAARLWLG
uniref:Uncharacterized protein n=1 Tax=Triticum urartu TaxID=4572 RepID=A0A8R7TXR7_TRIUA